MPNTLPWLNPNSFDFPPLDSALTDPNGLLAIGGDLSPQRIVSAYQHAVFPWFNEGEPILWWSPTPRAIIEIEHLRVNRTLKKVLNRKLFNVTVNNAFDEVIEYCADAPFRKEGTWIGSDMLATYKELHQLGFAHSIEVWQNHELVGGLYGVAINGFFSGESMFYTKANASKVALVALAQLLKSQKVNFIDCQIDNLFLSSMGSIEVNRADFIKRQQKAKAINLPKDFWLPRSL